MKWTIQYKLLAAFGSVVLVQFVMTIINWNMMSSSTQALLQARDKGYAGAMLATSIRYDVTQVWQWLTDISATRGEAGFDDGYTRAEEYAQKFRSDVAALRALHPDDGPKLDALSQSFEEFYEKGKWMASQFIEGGPALGNPAMLEFDQYGEDINSQLDQTVTKFSKDGNLLIQQSISQNTSNQNISLILAAVAIIWAVWIALILANSLSKGIRQIVSAASQIAQGDLTRLASASAAIANGDLTTRIALQTTELTYQSNDEIGMLVEIFNQMIARLRETGSAFSKMTENLSELVGQVAANSHDVNRAAAQMSLAAENTGKATGQILSSVEEIARGAAQQSTAVSNTASSLAQNALVIQSLAKGAQEQAVAVQKAAQLTDQIASAIEEVSRNAQEGSLKSTEAAQAAHIGAQTVSETIQKMGSIQKKVSLSASKITEMGQRSEQIGTIIETIDDLASQTNLLSLNAAIEAARAGEHGKGFGVVAEEVRKLAERSRSAAKEIGDLVQAIQQTTLEAVQAIEEGLSEVGIGVAQSSEARQALAKIVNTMESVSLQVNKIASSAEVMRASSQELVDATDTVNTIVHKNNEATKQMKNESAVIMQEMDRIVKVSTQNSTTVAEVNSSVMSMRNQVTEVASATQSLIQMAEGLQTAVEQFKLSEQNSPAERPAPAGVKSSIRAYLSSDQI